ncbi:SMI1/KNR4 family protein [Streptomyces sp. NPDC006923]|uniref:SMI1/KNR4 family protein n=1 Tax=Streptomyces sp. NPDC006923 TaxID=3155355 RepID=UPI00340AC37A
MNVEIPPRIRDTASRLGTGVPYALKVLVGRLADSPDMGRPSGLSGILTVTVDGDLFEDCPTLTIGYIREPNRIEVRYVNPTPSDKPAANAQDQEDQDQSPDSAADAVTEREIADAWQRIIRWLEQHAPESHAAVRVGVSSDAITALEHGLGTRIPVALRALWLLTAGDDGVHGQGWLPGNEALMPLDAVADFYRERMAAQAYEDTVHARHPERDRFTVWKEAWIPVASFGVADRTSGLYLDAATGYLGRWSRYNEEPGEELDTLVTYLEEAADMLEAPALATRDRPGLIGGTLVWGSMLHPAQADHWQPLTMSSRLSPRGVST